MVNHRTDWSWLSMIARYYSCVSRDDVSSDEIFSHPFPSNSFSHTLPDVFMNKFKRYMKSDGKHQSHSQHHSRSVQLFQPKPCAELFMCHSHQINWSSYSCNYNNLSRVNIPIARAKLNKTEESHKFHEFSKKTVFLYKSLKTIFSFPLVYWILFLS